MAFQLKCILPLLLVISSSLYSCGAVLGDSDELCGNDNDEHLTYSEMFLSTVEDWGTFKSLIKQSTDVLRMSGCDQSELRSSDQYLQPKTVNVDNYGAKGDGSSDDTHAFRNAWKAACSNSQGAILVVPQKNYLLKPIRFSGPCKSSIKVQIYGTLQASDNPADYKQDSTHWLRFDRLQGLTVEGGGTINGNGKQWWKNSCKVKKKNPCKDAPTALTFYQNQNLIVKNLNIRDAQQIHVSFQDSSHVHASGLKVVAPGDSPNTDGIHITNTQNIQISSSTIGTGDDCISIVSGSKNVQASDITCGPGHGISIGSLGQGRSEDYVSGITVNGAKFSGTQNGVRIKTWQGGSGSVSNIKFQNVKMDNVQNPIIIDQNYCDQSNPCEKQRSAVQIRNVMYKNIQGTSATDVAVSLKCSDRFPCQGVVFQNISLKAQGGGAAKAVCENVKYTNIGSVSPRCSAPKLATPY